MPTRLRILLPACAFVAFGFALLLAEPGRAPTTPGRAQVAIPDEFHAKSVWYARKQPRPTLGERVAKIALEAVGVPYRWGGASPAGGFDCSGLIYWAYGRLDVDVPHSSYALYDLGRRVGRSGLKPGDVLFFSGLGHVGLYLGRGRMVHAPQSGRTVEVVALDGSHYGERLVGVRRLGRAVG
jgi:cell wall-associated NlpC family hydrolase